MGLKKSERPEVEAEKIWDGDVLERKNFAVELSNLVTTISQPFVIGLHASYGMGKSFYLERWQEDLKCQGYRVVLFNAWETDFSHDPLSAFIVALKKGLDDGRFTKKLNNYRLTPVGS